MVRYVKFAFVFVLFPFSVHATVSPEDVSRQLVVAFAAELGAKAPKPSMVEKDYVGMKVRTIVFGIGNRVYRMVFSSDGSITVALTTEGSIAAQPLWKTTAAKTSVEELVNLVYSREFGRKYNSSLRYAETNSNDGDDEETQLKAKRPESGSYLRWNNLMNRVLRGDTPSIASGGDVGSIAALGKMMSPCTSGASPQKTAALNIAEAISATVTGDRDLLVDRSRDFEKKGKYAFLSDLDRYDRTANPDEAFRLIKQSASESAEIFQAALKNADPDSRDPYALAALRNFRTVARGVGEEKGKALVDQVLSRTVVDIEGFTMLRRGAPKTPVIYSRVAKKYYVDPTLNSPSEARYLLSLATLYEWRLTETEIAKLLQRYDDLQKQITLIEHAILDSNDEKRLAAARTEADQVSRKLFALSEDLRHAPATPDR